MKLPFHRFALGLCGVTIFCTWARIRADEPAAAQEQELRCRVIGLFSPDRQEDLRRAMADLTDAKLIRIDFDHAEATILFNRAKAFGKNPATPQQIIERLDDEVGKASSFTFRVKAASGTPTEKLTPVEIPVAGLDCKACALAAYEAIAGIDGVAQATASFREGRVTALIDPEKTNRAALEAGLKKHEVDVLPTAPAAPAKP